ncbi:MAG: acetate--CoA ligase family protein [Methanomicrobiaceae archaeon]|nr:acetate--CoA ligase family protein [Methanomicrobiaceae archaeon]MDD5418534.1 acetate--CoA ligase family protein [Methanomicrobiaceae archaeon]
MAEKLLSEVEGYQLLHRFGIPAPPHRIVERESDAVRAAEEIGYPVVMKIISPQIVHKSDVGGVITGIANEGGAKEAFRTIMKNAAAHMPDAEIRGILVEKQMPPGLEVLIGGKTDPAFGKVITFGMGGTLVEFLKDVSLRVLPLTKEEIREMVRDIRGYQLIQGFRGESPKDEEALVNIIAAMADGFVQDSQILEFDLNPVILYESGAAVVDARIIVDGGETARRPVSLEVDPEIFYPESIAVVGASTNPTKVGYAVFRNLLSFRGELYPVNPKRAEIFGRKVYPSMGDIPGTVDMAVIAVPASVVPGVMEEAGRKGVRLAVIITAGFRESGERGRELEEEVMRIARKHGIRVVGPNCLGIMLPHKEINSTFTPVSPKPGHIAFISQSGAIITTVVDWSLPEEIGFSAVISVGNQADLGFEHYLKFVEQDPDTRSITLYIEEIKDGWSFINSVREVAITKPVVAVKSGASEKGRKAASSHTGSLAGTYDVYMAAFKQAGVIPVESLREAFHLAELLASEGYPEGKRAMVITSAGGFAVLSSDYAETYGIEMADIPEAMLEELNAFLPPDWSRANPMDIIGDAGADRYARVFDVMIKYQDAWDIAFVIGVPSALMNPGHLANEIVRFSRNTRKMVVGCVLGGDSMKSGMRILRMCYIPNFSELEDAFKAVGSIIEVRTGRAPGFRPIELDYRCPAGRQA